MVLGDEVAAPGGPDGLVSWPPIWSRGTAPPWRAAYVADDLEGVRRLE